MREKSIRRNYVYNLGYQVFFMITSLITAPYLSRVLEPDGIGTISYVGAVEAYFALFAAMKIPIYGQREISYARDSLEERSAVFWNVKLLGFIFSAVVLPVYIVFSFRQEESSAIYLLFALHLISQFFNVTWFFQGMEEFGKTVLCSTVSRCLYVIFVFTFVRSKGDLPIYVLGLGAYELLGNLLPWAYLPRYVGRVPRSRLRPLRSVKGVLSLFVPAITVQIYSNFAKVMIRAITGSYFENGCYEQAVRIVGIFLSLITISVTVSVPRIGYYFGKNDADGIRRLMYGSYRFAWFLGVPMCLGTIMVAGNFVPWYFGAGYEKVVRLLHILPFVILPAIISSVTGSQYLVPTKRQGLLTVTVVMGACASFALNLVLIRRFQSMGAAAAMVATELLVAAVQLALVRKELAFRQILQEGVHYYAAGAAMALVLWPVSRALSPSVGHTAIIAACGAAAYFCVLFIERDELVLSGAAMAFRKLRGRD